MKKNLIMLFIAFIAGLSCMKHTIGTPQTAKEPALVTQRLVQGDTTSYVIGFSSQRELHSFQRKFERLIEVYTFDTVVSDTINRYFFLKVKPLKKEPAPEKKHALEVIDPAAFVESDIHIGKPDTVVDSLPVHAGGAITIYTDRGFMDAPLAALVSSGPLPDPERLFRQPDKPDSLTGAFLRMTQVSAAKIKITGTGNLVNHTGKPLSAFDVVQAWNDFVKKNPAEGSALFSAVKGVAPFIRGEEAVIAGFSVTDENTIMVSLARPDALAVQGLNVPGLLPASLNLGRFFVKKQTGNRILLLRNQHYPFDKPLLDTIKVVCGKDKNPFVPYSLHDYDVLVLYRKSDLDYARRSFAQHSRLVPLVTDRYFISLAHSQPEVRAFLAQLIDPFAIQVNAVKAEGKITGSLESSGETPVRGKTASAPQSVALQAPLEILYNTDDPVSVTIAEKIFSDLSLTAISARLKGLSGLKLETALIQREYDIAVGWVSGTDTADQAEKLRPASIWFDHETDETRRRGDHWEIPLFTVDRFVLVKKNIIFHHNRISGMYRAGQ